MRLKLSLAQIAVADAKPDINLRKAESFIAKAASEGSQLIVFPEMWTTGFPWDYLSRHADEHARTISKIGDMAKKYRIWINGSYPSLNPSGLLANASLLFNTEGAMKGSYSKAHLFPLAHEDKHLSPGNHLAAVPAPWGKTGLAICYDLRFPEVFRSYAIQGVILTILPAAVPYPRLEHWKILCKARAIENQMYMVCVNQVGRGRWPNLDVTYFGTSTIIDPWGEVIAECPEKEEMLVTVEIDMEKVQDVRAAIPVLNGRRPDVYQL